MHAVEVFVRDAVEPVRLRRGDYDLGLSGADELRGAVDILHREGEVARDQRDMFGGLLELEDVPVGDVMIHRTKMRTLDADLPPAELVREALASPYTRMPLWRGEPDNIIGILHVKDLFRAYTAAGRRRFEAEARPTSRSTPGSSPTPRPAATSCRRSCAARPIRRWWSTNTASCSASSRSKTSSRRSSATSTTSTTSRMQGVRQQLDGSLIVDGSVPIRDLNRMMDWDLPDEEAATVAGLVIHEARTIPEARQAFVFHGFRFEVLRKAEETASSALRVTPMGAKGKAKAAS